MGLVSVVHIMQMLIYNGSDKTGRGDERVVGVKLDQWQAVKRQPSVPAPGLAAHEQVI